MHFKTVFRTEYKNKSSSAKIKIFGNPKYNPTIITCQSYSLRIVQIDLEKYSKRLQFHS